MTSCRQRWAVLGCAGAGLKYIMIFKEHNPGTNWLGECEQTDSHDGGIEDGGRGGWGG